MPVRGTGIITVIIFLKLPGRTIAVQVKTGKEQKIMQKGFVGSKEEMQKIERWQKKNSPHWRWAGAGKKVVYGVILKGYTVNCVYIIR